MTQLSERSLPTPKDPSLNPVIDILLLNILYLLLIDENKEKRAGNGRHRSPHAKMSPNEFIAPVTGVWILPHKKFWLSWLTLWAEQWLPCFDASPIAIWPFYHSMFNISTTLNKRVAFNRHGKRVRLRERESFWERWDIERDCKGECLE